MLHLGSNHTVQRVFGMNFVHCWFQCELCFRRAWWEILESSITASLHHKWTFISLFQNWRIVSKNLWKIQQSATIITFFLWECTVTFNKSIHNTIISDLQYYTFYTNATIKRKLFHFNIKPKTTMCFF